MPILTCLIGVSGFGDVHYQDVIRECAAGHMQILGVCVINQDQELEKCAALRALGATIHSDYQEMLDTYAGRVQLCLIPTGIPLHRPMTLAALKVGANVFVEKPAAATIDDVDVMIAAEKASSAFVAVGYQSMYNGAVHEMKQALLSGMIGTVREVRCICLGPRMDSYYARNAWAGQVSLNGTWVLDAPFSNAFSHFITLALYFAGKSTAQTATPTAMDVELYRAHDITSCDASSWKICTEENIDVRFYTSHCSEKYAPQTFEIKGSVGSCRWEYNYNQSQAIFKNQAGEVIKSICYVFANRPNIMQALYRRITDKSSFVCDLSIARAPVLCVNAAFMAAPIETIDTQYIKRVTLESGEVQTVVAGMQESMFAAFEQGAQVSEVNDTWARSGSVIDLGDLHSFTGLPA